MTMSHHYPIVVISALMLAACSGKGKSTSGVDEGEPHAGADAAADGGVLVDGAVTLPDGAAAPAEGGSGAAGDPATEGNQLLDAAVGGDDDAGESRRPLLAAGGPQLLISGPRVGLQLTAANLAQDAPAIAIHQEFYGLPWEAFDQNVAPPKEWSDLVSSLATFTVDQHKPVFLSLSMLNGGRERLAATAHVEAGQLRVDDTSSDSCYDFAAAPDRDAKKAAYLRYVDFMLERFDPKYLNFGIEVNLFFEKCPAATPGLRAFLNEVYQHVKEAKPQLIAFPSFQLDHLYGYSDQSCADASKRAECYERNYAQLDGIERDRFAISTYPFLSQVTKLQDLPEDWFERAAKRGNERAVIAETGWLSTNLIARNSRNCVTAFSSSEADSVAYLTRVLSEAKRLDMDLVTWWSDRDLLPTELMTDCPCTYDTEWCAVLDGFRGPEQPLNPDGPYYTELALKIFGTMGLRKYDGTAKDALLSVWNASK